MTTEPDDHRTERHDRRIKLAGAAIGGTLAGVARAALDWLLQRLTSH